MANTVDFDSGTISSNLVRRTKNWSMGLLGVATALSRQKSDRFKSDIDRNTHLRLRNQADSKSVGQCSTHCRCAISEQSIDGEMRASQAQA